MMKDARGALDALAAITTQAAGGALSPQQRADLLGAIARARAQVVSGATPVLLVALVGPSGAGKSTLINALAQGEVARAGAIRPTTVRPTVFHHGSIAGGGVPAELAPDLTFVPHERERLRTKAIIDTPDLDTYVTTNRERTRAVLRAAGLVIYVFSPERYMEERVWSVIREEHAFSQCAAVLNKCDQLSREERGVVVEELRARFAELGVPDLPVFMTSATDTSDAGVERLLAYLEETLRVSDTAVLVRRQHEAVAAELERAASPLQRDDLDDALENARAALREAAEKEVERAIIERAPDIASAEDRARAAAAVARTAGFWGPMRAWLGIWDTLRYSLPELARRSLGHPPMARRQVLADALAPASRRAAESAREQLFRAGLPVEAWLGVLPPDLESRASSLAAGAIERLAGAQSPWSMARMRLAVVLGSSLGLLLPACLVGLGGYLLVRDLLQARYDGMALFGHLCALTVLAFIALHALVALLMPGPTSIRGRVGRSLLVSAACAPVETAISEYAREIERASREVRENVNVVRESLCSTDPRPEP